MKYSTKKAEEDEIIESKTNRDLIINFSHRQLVIHHRYEVLHIINDIAIGLWFFIGSILFFFENLMYIGTWLFVIGSGQMLIRPFIRIAHKIHLRNKETSLYNHNTHRS